MRLEGGHALGQGCLNQRSGKTWGRCRRGVLGGWNECQNEATAESFQAGFRGGSELSSLPSLQHISVPSTQGRSVSYTVK